LPILPGLSFREETTVLVVSGPEGVTNKRELVERLTKEDDQRRWVGLIMSHLRDPLAGA
jgi:hypothetical protein